jgi:hypothetical protein
VRLPDAYSGKPTLPRPHSWLVPLGHRLNLQVRQYRAPMAKNRNKEPLARYEIAREEVKLAVGAADPVGCWLWALRRTSTTTSWAT